MKRTISIDTYMMMQATVFGYNSLTSAKERVDKMLELNGVEVESKKEPTSTLAEPLTTKEWASAKDKYVSCNTCKHYFEPCYSLCISTSSNLKHWEKP